MQSAWGGTALIVRAFPYLLWTVESKSAHGKISSPWASPSLYLHACPVRDDLPIVISVGMGRQVLLDLKMACVPSNQGQEKQQKPQIFCGGNGLLGTPFLTHKPTEKVYVFWEREKTHKEKKQNKHFTGLSRDLGGGGILFMCFSPP